MIDRNELDIMKNWKQDAENPVVSVCTISYNHEQFISEALDSFLMQKTDFPFEIVVSDDCSIDMTQKIIKEYQDRFPRIIKANLRSQNVGMYINGSENLLNAKGTYVALCEGDDYWTDDKKLQLQVDKMREYKEYGLSFHLASQHYTNNKKVLPRLHDADKLYTVDEIINGDFHLVQTNTMMFKREALSKVDETLLQDSPVGDVWLRVAAAIPNGAIFINKIMGAYRVQSAGSWSESMTKDENFLPYVSKMLRSIDAFDKHWEHRYTKAFSKYKNKFIKTVIRRKEIDTEEKAIFLKSHISLMTITDRLEWNIFYKHKVIAQVLNTLKNSIKGQGKL